MTFLCLPVEISEDWSALGGAGMGSCIGPTMFFGPALSDSSWWWCCTIEVTIGIQSEERSDNQDFIAPTPPPLPLFVTVILVTVYDK